MGNQNVACCGAALTQGTNNSKSSIETSHCLEMKTKKNDRNPNIFEDKKSQFLNLSQFEQSDGGFEWDQQLDEEERKEIILARSEL